MRQSSDKTPSYIKIVQWGSVSRDDTRVCLVYKLSFKNALRSFQELRVTSVDVLHVCTPAALWLFYRWLQLWPTERWEPSLVQPLQMQQVVILKVLPTVLINTLQFNFQKGLFFPQNLVCNHFSAEVLVFSYHLCLYFCLLQRLYCTQLAI